MPTAVELGALFEELFKKDELQQFIEQQFGLEVVNAVEWGGSASIAVWKAAGALERRGLVTEGLARALQAARTGKAGTIAQAFGMPAQAPQPATVASSVGEGEPASPSAPASPTAYPRTDPSGAVRILHLSDLHLRLDTQPGHDALLRAAVTRIREDLVQQGLGPHLVALTGDLAYYGKTAEFDLVRAWLTDHLLPAVGLSPAQVMVVPGNHDLDRKVAQDSMAHDLEDLARQSADKADRYLRSAPHMAEFHKRYAAYLQFLEDLGVAHPRTPSWSWRPFGADLDLFVVGLDTAWLHSRDKVQGQLVVGRRMVDAALAARRDGDTVVALTHHPLDWLIEWDQGDVLPPFERRVDLHLHGHLHVQRPRKHTGPNSSHLRLPTGSLYAGHRWANGFQLVEHDLSGRAGVVHPFVWLPDEDTWCRDFTRYRPDGRWRYSLDA